jgi:hypothetical protein
MYNVSLAQYKELLCDYISVTGYVKQKKERFLSCFKNGIPHVFQFLKIESRQISKFHKKLKKWMKIEMDERTS